MSSIYVVFNTDSNVSYTTLNLYPNYVDSAFKHQTTESLLHLKIHNGNSDFHIMDLISTEGPVTKTHM